MTDRKGEKLGWTGGWLGGFVWVAILALVFLFQGRTAQGLVGLALTGAAAGVIIRCAPWRFPRTPYWRLMLAPYAAFFLSIAWAVWAYGGLAAVGLNWWNLAWLLPMLIPLGTLSKRTWADGEPSA
jgi:hypothetical protein